MTNLPEAIVLGGAFIAVGMFFGLTAIADALNALRELLHDFLVEVNHYIIDKEGGKDGN